MANKPWIAPTLTLPDGTVVNYYGRPDLRPVVEAAVSTVEYLENVCPHVIHTPRGVTACDLPKGHLGPCFAV